MKLQLNKKKLINLSKDAQILPEDMTPNVGGGTLRSVGCPATNITIDWTCNGTGSCGCISLGNCNTNTCY